MSLGIIKSIQTLCLSRFALLSADQSCITDPNIRQTRRGLLAQALMKGKIPLVEGYMIMPVTGTYIGVEELSLLVVPPTPFTDSLWSEMVAQIREIARAFGQSTICTEFGILPTEEFGRSSVPQALTWSVSPAKPEDPRTDYTEIPGFGFLIGTLTLTPKES